jgi:hypothetical protein
MRLYGIPVRNDDIDTLIDLLHRVGRAEDLELAMRLKRGISLGTTLLALSGDERDLLLSVLDDPPKASSNSGVRSRATTVTGSSNDRVIGVSGQRVVSSKTGSTQTFGPGHRDAGGKRHSPKRPSPLSNRWAPRSPRKSK